MNALAQIAAVIGVAAAPVFAAGPPAVTRWMEPEGRPRPLHASGPTTASAQPSIRSLSETRSALRLGTATNRICVMVRSNVLASVSNELAQYQTELRNAGFSVTMSRYDSGTAVDVRNALISLYAEPESLVGAVFIGDVPAITYELTQDFGTGEEYEDFPCDLFFMDLNGTWQDLTNVSPFAAGKYDTRQGDLGLEIWVARVKTSNLSSLGSETNLLKKYFDKNHRYRAGLLVPFRRALVYDDDDWSSMTTGDAQDLGWIYGSHVSATMDAEGTAAGDYKNNHMVENYDLVQVRSHGYSGGHGFYTNSHTKFDYVYPADYRKLTPRALFYSFYVCSGADYGAANYLAGTAVFNTNDAGLVAWGSTKTGGMWDDNLFYDPLSKGICIGESFRRWFNSMQTSFASWTPKWWYGMVLVGDASLTLNAGVPSLTNAGVNGELPVTQWAAVEGDVYALQRCVDPIRGAWTNVGGIVTAQSYAVLLTDPSPAGFGIYRVARDEAASANLLENESFEAPGTSDATARYWLAGTPDSHGGTWDNAARVGWRAHSGYWEAAVRGTWAGLGQGGWWREAAAGVGTTYQASAWFWADATWTAAVQLLKIEFYSSSYGARLSTTSTDLSDVHEAWTQKTVSAVAPAGTAWARLVVDASGAGAAGALQVDDARLVVQH